MGGKSQDMKKTCLQCGIDIFKKPNASRASWFSRVKYCSFQCRADAQRGRPMTEETRRKMSVAHIGNKSNLGRKLTEEHKLKVRLSLRGEKHWNWQGGKTKENHIRRNRIEYTEWRKAVFERDGYKCKIANSDCVHEVHAHHILRFSEYPEIRYDLNNGITLCKNHHPLKRSHEQELAPLFKSLIWQP